MHKPRESKTEIFKRLTENPALQTAKALQNFSPNDERPPFKEKGMLAREVSFQAIPLYQARVSAGLPSPVQDPLEQSIDLHGFLVPNAGTTFCVRVEGNSMLGAGIHNNDLLIVDSQKRPKTQDIVVASLYGEVTVKRLKIGNQKTFLVPENPQFNPIEITESMDFTLLGVVLHVIHSF